MTSHAVTQLTKMFGTTHFFSMGVASRFWSLVRCLKWDPNPARL